MYPRYSSDQLKIDEFQGWFYLIDEEDGVLSRWPTHALAEFEFQVLTGRDWVESQ